MLSKAPCRKRKQKLLAQLLRQLLLLGAEMMLLDPRGQSHKQQAKRRPQS